MGAGLCIGIGGVRIDRAVALQILEAVSERTVEAAIFASDQVEQSRKDAIAAVERELEAARYEASLAARRYELVDPAKRHVARELEARWNDALERVAALERRIEELSTASAARPSIDRARLLTHDLPAVWNAPTTDTRTKQRLIPILVQEIVCELDDATNEAVLLIHWTGGRHNELRVPRVKTGRYLVATLEAIAAGHPIAASTTSRHGLSSLRQPASGRAGRRRLPMNGAAAEARLATRRQEVAPLIIDLEAWMRGERARLSRHAPVAKAID